MPNSTEEVPMYQVVVLIMSDGQELHFTGPAGAKEGDTVKDIKFSAPMHMPSGATWGKIGDDAP